MKKRLLTTFAATLSLFMSQCSELPTQKETADGSKSIRIEIKTAPGFDTVAARAYVQISADDMKTTITQKLTISNDWISGVVRNIPVGYDRHFEVFVEGFDSTLLYYGDTTASIYSGKETYVTIILRKPGGTAIINGYIEEYKPPKDTIPAPETPYIYAIDTAGTTPPRISRVTMVTNGSKYPDSLFYIWRIVYITKYDTFTTKHTTGMVYNLDYPEDGMYQVSVRAMSMYDTLSKSPGSFALVFTILDGMITNTTFPDTTFPVIYLNGPDTVFLQLNSKYIEQGAKAYDKVDGDLTKFIKISGNVNTSKTGSYYITYTVSDNSYNISTRSRLIIVENFSRKDTTPPVIKLTGPSIIEIDTNDTIFEPGYTAWDDIDGDITSLVKTWSVTDTGDPNETRIIYSVCDKSGNCSTVYRTIIKVAKALQTPTMPIITSSKFNGKTMSISFQTSVIKPVSTGTVYYVWSIFISDTQSAGITTQKNSMTYDFKNNTTYSVLVMAHCLSEISHVSKVLQFSVIDGKVFYPDVMKTL